MTSKVPMDNEHFLDRSFFYPLIGSFRLKLTLLGVFLVGNVLWHINRCRLFDAKSIFIHISSSISNYAVLHNYTF